MIPFFHISDKAPPPEKHRRFRLIVATLILLTAIAIALQPTSHALLASDKTDSLWGILAGMVVMAVLVEWVWSRGARRSDRA